jgi:hypothetical protein
MPNRKADKIGNTLGKVPWKKARTWEENEEF